MAKHLGTRPAGASLVGTAVDTTTRPGATVHRGAPPVPCASVGNVVSVARRPQATVHLGHVAEAPAGVPGVVVDETRRPEATVHRGAFDHLLLGPPESEPEPDPVTELDAFTCRLGTAQGRVAPGVFVLGSAELGYVFDLALGDRAELVQDVDVTGVDLVRTRMRLRVPDGLPGGFAWEASLVVDGRKVARAVTRPGWTRELTDLAANVSKLSGVHGVGVRLELVEAT